MCRLRSQSIQSYGAWAGQYGQNNKCFSCESQYSPNPFKLESYGIKMPQGASPYCNAEELKKCKKNPSLSRYGWANGKSYDDHIENDGVGLVNGFGRVDGMGSSLEGDQNPTGYTLN